MELDDLKAAFADLERRVIDVEAAVRRGPEIRRRWNAMRRPLIVLGLFQTLSTIFGLYIIARIAPFWIANRHEPAMLLSGIVVHLYGVAVVCGSVLQLLMIARTYYTDAVVPFQRRLSELLRVRVVTGWIAGLPWWILWMLLIIIVVKAETGLNLYVLRPGWVFGSLLVGVIGMVVTFTTWQRWSRNPPASPFLRSLVAGSDGPSLDRINRRLAELDQFARE